ncbi:phage tail tape-measure protein [Roseovarius sp. MBR-38]|jgi:phage tail tape-measure protein
MATLVLGAVGTAIGGSIGGSLLGVSAASIGGFVGSSLGGVIDNWIVSALAPAQRIEGARLDSLTVTASTEGAVSTAETKPATWRCKSRPVAGH